MALMKETVAYAQQSRANAESEHGQSVCPRHLEIVYKMGRRICDVDRSAKQRKIVEEQVRNLADIYRAVCAAEIGIDDAHGMISAAWTDHTEWWLPVGTIGRLTDAAPAYSRPSAEELAGLLLRLQDIKRLGGANKAAAHVVGALYRVTPEAILLMLRRKQSTKAKTPTAMLGEGVLAEALIAFYAVPREDAYEGISKMIDGARQKAGSNTIVAGGYPLG